MDKVVFVFNQFYSNCANDLLENSSDKLSETLKDHLEAAKKIKGKDGAHLNNRNIDRFIRYLSDEAIALMSTTAASGDKCILDHDSVKQLLIFKHVCVKDIVDSVVDKQSLKCYIYIFALLGFLYIKYDCDTFEDSSDDENDEEDEDEKQSKLDSLKKQNSEIIDNVLTSLKLVQKGKKCEEIPEIKCAVSAGFLSNISGVIKVVDEESAVVDDDVTGHTAAEMLKNTKIGSLAKEISEELDLGSINIEKPEDLLDMSSKGVLGNIIGKVGNKIHQKIEKGELKHEDLMTEAMSMLSILGKGDANGVGGGMGAMFNNPMFKDVMKNMGNLSGLASMMKNNEKSKGSHVKDRLRKKLEERNSKQ